MRARRDAVAAPGDDAEGEHDERRADQAELLGDHRVDEVGLRLGQEAHFLLPAHETTAYDPTGPNSNKGLDDLKAFAERVFPGSSQLWIRLMRYSCVMTSAMNAGTNATTRPTR